jgi:4-diphosphocytidyl-2-C-methyl-D-erythritol kinase
LTEFAPAKVNLTLHVLGRRADGYHEIESLVAFADIGDRLTFAPGDTLALGVSGPTAQAAGATDDNLVLKAARALAERVEGLRLGRFTLEKRLPVAAGLGGGSSDAAAALRLLARENGIALDDPRLMAAAQATGADVPVCVDPRARMMRGIGEILSDPVALPELPAVLVNPGVAVPTKDVFKALAAPPLSSSDRSEDFLTIDADAAALVSILSARRNDLETPAIKLQSVIADALTALQESGCLLARMSGSGATCFGLFGSVAAAADVAQRMQVDHPGWWVQATRFG